MKISEFTTPLQEDDIDYAAVMNDTLNPKIWDHGKMLPEVRSTLLKIADNFKSFLGINDLEIVDITISGSNAAYSYTPYSDLDLHLLVDIAKLDDDKIYRELFDSKKYQYNDMHNIFIRGINVELYVQDSGFSVVSLGEFSVKDNKWIREPSKKAFTFDSKEVQDKFDELKTRSTRALKGNSNTRITAVLTDINRARKSGLAEGGEFSAENLVYKMLRNSGIIDKLWAAKNALDDRELSLEAVSEAADDMTGNTVTLWHGGRGLEHSFRDITPSAKGRWEHGPGLYLTTSYRRASEYAKGSRKVYKVTFTRGTDISKVKLPYHDVLQFANQYVIGSKRKEFLGYIKENMDRMGSDTEVAANVFLNLCIYNNAVSSSNTVAINQFLVNHGIDYSIVKNFGGSGETVVVIFNRNKIVNVVPMKAKDPIAQDEFDVQFTPESSESPLVLTDTRSAAKAWIEKVYSLYPTTFQNNHVMLWGEGENQQMASFELTPSFGRRGAVEVKWIAAYPLRQGVGSRAMKELQRLAKEDNISLTLFPWDKGQVSQAKLTKFYKGQGFKPVNKGSKSMVWTPESLEEGWKDWVAGAAIAGAAAMGGAADAKHIPNAPFGGKPSANAQAAKSKVKTTQQVKPVAQPDKNLSQIVQTVLKPEAKVLIKAGKSAGMKGAELAQFVAQCAHETANFSTLKEFGGSADFKKYDPRHNPRKAKMLGNTHVGDGAKYHGRGYIQLTGRDNYKRAGEALGLPLEKNPDLVERPDIAAKVAVWFWQNHVQPRVSNFTDTVAVTKPINSGLKGLDDRHNKYSAIMQLMRG